jgi:ferric-dicitrate binding protein FerR (iron transport regulator)
MSTQQASPYREEDAEARARLDAEQREELAEQARIQELSRRALAKEEKKEEKEEVPIQRSGWVTSAAAGLAIGAALGGVGWWATNDWSVFLAAPIVGIIIGVVVTGLWGKPEGKFIGPSKPIISTESLRDFF